MTSTSAGIGEHRVEDAARSLRRDERVRRVRRAVSAGAGVLLVGLTSTFALIVAQADDVSRCHAERDESGHGQRAALRALEDPEAQTRFFYRVTADPAGYRARVVVRDGPFAGDAWERDAVGQVRHLSDVCRDRAAGRWAAVMDEVLEPLPVDGA